MPKSKEEIASQAQKNRENKIIEARLLLTSNQHLRGYLSSRPHPFDHKMPTSTQQRSLLTYYEWGLNKARHYKQYEIAKDILKLPVAHYQMKGGDAK